MELEKIVRFKFEFMECVFAAVSMEIKKGQNMLKTLEKLTHIYLIICVLIWIVQCIKL